MNQTRPFKCPIQLIQDTIVVHTNTTKIVIYHQKFIQNQASQLACLDCQNSKSFKKYNITRKKIQIKYIDNRFNYMVLQLFLAKYLIKREEKKMHICYVLELFFILHTCINSIPLYSNIIQIFLLINSFLLELQATKRTEQKKNIITYNSNIHIQ